MRRLGVLLAGLLLLAGCGSAAPAATAVTGVLSFTGTTIDGAKFDAASLAGKPALLWFWAPWCATCAGQAGSVGNAQTEYGDRLGILGVGGMGSNADMHEFVDDLEVGSITNLDDEAGVLWRQFKITEQSTYVLVGADGRVRKTGYLDDQQLTAELEALVG